jgi:serine/threonine protein phosphatase PrpC
VVYLNNENIYCANAGDSRSVLFSNDKVFPLSEDHKPDNTDELKRINAANHFVEESRVDGNLALSRAFGDF